MDYKGVKEAKDEKDDEHYVFQCPKCNSIEEIAAKELDAHLYDCSHEINIF